MPLNPFTSFHFKTVWHKHFATNKPLYDFKVLKNLSFFKLSSLPIYINIGENLTKGISYILDTNPTYSDYIKKVFLIYDVPQYFHINSKNRPKDLELKKINQYPGYLISLNKYTDLNDYLKQTFSKSSVQKFNRYKKRLESCFNIKEKMLIGNVDKIEYDVVFNHFKTLLTKRFEDKQITNNNLNPKEWGFYYDVAYPMILEKKAALHIVYSNDTPISVRLLYFSDTTIFDAITVFDIDYTKFHIGKVALMKMLEWSFNSPYTIFDFSKGYFDYKESWSDTKYNFEYHVYYDAKAFKTLVLGNTIAAFFKFKQYLRDKELNNKLHKLSFLIRKEKSKNTQINMNIVEESRIDLTTAIWTKIDINNTEYVYLKKHVYDFLFLNNEHINETDVFSMSHTNNIPTFLFKSRNSQLILSKDEK